MIASRRPKSWGTSSKGQALKRHALLKNLHELLQPRNYLEIGVNLGLSLTLSRCRTIGVDPAFKVTQELQCDVHLVRATSDEFFSREHPLAQHPDHR